MHDLQRWSEDEVFIRKKKTKSKSQMPKNFQNANSPTQQNTGSNSKIIEIAKIGYMQDIKGYKQ